MKKDRQPFAGGHDSKRPERGPKPSEKDKGTMPRRPDELGGNPMDWAPSPEPRSGGKGMPGDERSDWESGRPVQLGEEGKPIPEPGRTETEPGRGDGQRDAREDRRPTGEPAKR